MDNFLLKSNAPQPFGCDPLLGGYTYIIERRKKKIESVVNKLTQNGIISLADASCAHNFFGLHFVNGKWIFREWAPRAVAITLVGDFSDW
jgi:1,4-alpha-glucan branching enzyme